MRRGAGSTFPPSEHPGKSEVSANFLQKPHALRVPRRPLLLFNLPSDVLQPAAAGEEGAVSQAICPASSERCCAATSRFPSLEGSRKHSPWFHQDSGPAGWRGPFNFIYFSLDC